MGTPCGPCRYVTGDYRFKTGFCKSNPRKMVKSWAEKEMRNLMRLHTAGIRCPRPVQLRMHVLVMDFIGADGRAAPRLKVSAWCKLKGSALSDGEVQPGQGLPGREADLRRHLLACRWLYAYCQVGPCLMETRSGKARL